jgi:hypothetical protein
MADVLKAVAYLAFVKGERHLIGSITSLNVDGKSSEKKRDNNSPKIHGQAKGGRSHHRTIP